MRGGVRGLCAYRRLTWSVVGGYVGTSIGIVGVKGGGRAIRFGRIVEY